MALSQTWLEDPAAIRIILADISYYDTGANANGNLLLSTLGYNTTDGKRAFPTLINDITFTESISIDGAINISFSDLELTNLNGEWDIAFNNTLYLFNNRKIRIYYGDAGWASSYANLANTFTCIFEGIIDDIDSKSNKTANIKIRDSLERLNTNITENKIGTYGTWAGGQQNMDTIKPIVFGEVFNMTPILIDPSTLEYLFCSSTADQTDMANNGACEELIEIRDNGVPIYNQELIGGVDVTLINGAIKYMLATVDLSKGTFKLNQTPAGTITASVKGVKKSINLGSGALQSTYLNTIANQIAVITTQFGKASTATTPARFTTAELDLVNFSAFNATSEVGIVINDTTNVLEVCQRIAQSVGASLTVTRTGLLRLLQFGVPYPAVPFTEITTSDIIYDSFSLVNRVPLEACKKIAYAKNWTVQAGLLTSIPDAHKTSFETEWLTVTQIDENIRALHNLTKDPVQKDTLLIVTNDATAESSRLLDYFKTQKHIYKFTGKAKLFSLTLGQQIKLTFPRFNLSTGVYGQVISLSPNWSKDQIDIEVII